jgi:4-phospho-D-threonate 3-dehydrogenase / 4-phospho-D-erythronate 3-dehydrogenase
MPDFIAPVRSTSEGAVLPLLVVTIGDPGGIGPEVVAKALADCDIRAMARWLVLGPEWALSDAAAQAGIVPYWSHARDAEVRAGEVALMDVPIGRHSVEATAGAPAGELSYRLVEDAIAMCIAGMKGKGRAAGVVTGPISKQAWQRAGHGEFPGHTELFAARFGVERFAMMFVSPKLRTILATAHVPLMAVGRALTVARVLETIELGFRACMDMGVERPRIAVCGLNPHAGEGGLLGAEDGEIIAPAIAAARESGIDARGPFPGDSIFSAAVNGVFDLVVAMYHDQGLIPVKLLDRDRAVNVTVGLPVVRTSPDHGTAFDIAVQNRADPGSMKAALALAAQMAGGHAPASEF